MSQLNHLNGKTDQISHERDSAAEEHLNLSKHVGDLARELDLKSRVCTEYQSDLVLTRSRCETLSKEIVVLQSRLDKDRQKLSKLVSNLQEADSELEKR